MAFTYFQQQITFRALGQEYKARFPFLEGGDDTDKQNMIALLEKAKHQIYDGDSICFSTRSCVLHQLFITEMDYAYLPRYVAAQVGLDQLYHGADFDTLIPFIKSVRSAWLNHQLQLLNQ